MKICKREACKYIPLYWFMQQVLYGATIEYTEGKEYFIIKYPDKK